WRPDMFFDSVARVNVAKGKMTNMLDLRNQVRRVAVLISLPVAQTANAERPPHDLILSNARIVDGSGKRAYRSDVALSGDLSAAIAPGIEGGAKRVIDVGGQVVAPGFIDVQTASSPCRRCLR